MKKKKTEKPKKHMKLREKLARILRLSWVRFEEMPPGPRKEDEEISHWVRRF